MSYKFLLIFSGLIFFYIPSVGNTLLIDKLFFEENSVKMFDSLNLSQKEFTDFIDKKRPSPILKLFKNKRAKNKKIVASLLAFPFPFGIVGLHRIYMGTAPYVPVVYIASLGGAFGILPFVDFCVILMDKNIDKYTNNKKVFMWVN